VEDLQAVPRHLAEHRRSAIAAIEEARVVARVEEERAGGAVGPSAGLRRREGAGTVRYARLVRHAVESGDGFETRVERAGFHGAGDRAAEDRVVVQAPGHVMD